MNPLYAPLPKSVIVHGAEYAIRWDAHTALRILAAFEDEALADAEKLGVLLRLLYPVPPPDAGEAVRLGVRFLNCGDAPQNADGPRVYSFSHDAALIYAALRRSHGVDAAQPMHWYQFAALFWDIGADTLFARVVYLRSRQACGKLTKEERAALAALGETAALPPRLTAEERQAGQRFHALLDKGRAEKAPPPDAADREREG